MVSREAAVGVAWFRLERVKGVENTETAVFVFRVTGNWSIGLYLSDMKFHKIFPKVLFNISVILVVTELLVCVCVCVCVVSVCLYKRLLL
jgi:hypothetical protein